MQEVRKLSTQSTKLLHTCCRSASSSIGSAPEPAAGPAAPSVAAAPSAAAAPPPAAAPSPAREAAACINLPHDCVRQLDCRCLDSGLSCQQMFPLVASSRQGCHRHQQRHQQRALVSSVVSNGSMSGVPRAVLLAPLPPDSSLLQPDVCVSTHKAHRRCPAGGRAPPRD